MKGMIDMIRSRKGFSIAEVMCAAFIVMLAVGGLATTFVTAVRTNRFASNYYNASCLARNRVQEARIRVFDELLAIAEPRRRVDKDGNDPSFGSDALIFERETIVTPVLVNCYDVTVNVYYPMSPGVLSTVPVQMKVLISSQLDSMVDLM